MSIIYENKGFDILTCKQDVLNFYPHFHSHIEMVYILEGKSRAFSNYNEFLLEKGDFFITFPNQIHSYNDIESIKSILFIFPKDLCLEYCSLLDSYVPETPVIKSNVCPNNILSILEAILVNNCSNTPLHSAITKGYFYVLLGEILEYIPLKKVESINLDTVHRILDFCTENYKTDLSLDIIAKALFINKFYISHLFSQKLKLKLNDFVNSLRVNDACNRLSKSESNITEIALQVGFNSIRSFNRLFYIKTGFTPSEYRKHNIKYNSKNII